MKDQQSGFALSPKAINAHYHLSGYESVGSTNAVAMEAARDAKADQLWVVAGQQTAGRGRRGRPWQSHPGNLAASLLLILPAKTQHTPLLGFVAGIALVRAITRFQKPDAIPATFKWPNDVLWEGAKLAGILLEAETLPTGELALVVGMGINIKTAPSGLAYPTTALSQMSLEVSAQDLFNELSHHWVECYEMWKSTTGRTEILAQWRANAAGIGQSIKVERHGDVVQGIFESIDKDGLLIVRTSAGEQVPITAGDVFFHPNNHSQ